MFENAIVFKET